MTSRLDITQRKRIIAGLFGAASVLAIAGAPQAASAQETLAQNDSAQPSTTPPAPDAQTAENEEPAIVVTGFRQSLQAALGAKRNDNGIVDVIVAEDIADFPDTNLAESLQRIPGVAIDRPRRRLHPGPPQSARGSGDDRRHRQLGRREPKPRLRFQHLRFRAVQPADGSQEPVGGGRRRVARSDRRPADRPPVRLSRRLRHVDERPDGL